MKWLEQEFQIQKPEDWYEVDLSSLRSKKGFSRAIKDKNFLQLLKVQRDIKKEEREIMENERVFYLLISLRKHIQRRIGYQVDFKRHFQTHGQMKAHR